jgi:hypothetical protein
MSEGRTVEKEFYRMKHKKEELIGKKVYVSDGVRQT